MRSAVRLDLVDVEAAGLAAAVRARLAEAGRDRDDDGVLAARRRELELAPLGDRALVDVAGEDQVGAGLDEPGEDAVSVRDRLLPRPPGRAEQVVVEGDDPVGASSGRPANVSAARSHLVVAKAPGLVPPRPHRVEAGDDERRPSGRPARSSPRAARTRCQGCVKRFGKVYGMSWLPGIVSSGSSRPAEEVRGALVLAAQPAVGEVAARDHELRPRLLDQPAQRLDRLRLVVPAEMQV